jgi:hypothetical protein
MTAFLHLFIPLKPRPTPPPCTMPPVFVDAAPCGLSYLVASCRPSNYATSTQTPLWVRSIQDAELYAIFHGVRQGMLRKYSHLCVYTDNTSAFYTLLSGRVSSSTPTRARILRRIYRLCMEHDLQIQLVHIPSILNLADKFSRHRLLHAAPSPANMQPILMHQSFTYAAVVPPLWYRRINMSTLSLQ